MNGSSHKPHILVVALSDLAHDPRADRQIMLLAGRYRVTAAGYADARVPGVEFVPVPRTARSMAGKVLGAAFLKLGMFENYYWASSGITHAYRALEAEAFDLILANDINTLPLACRLGSRHGIIFDAHEYSPREFEDRLLWRFLFQRYNEYLCRQYLSRADRMITVCQGIADEYRSHYGVSAEVLSNAPRYQDFEPSVTAPGTVRMVHHGIAIASRKIELMIDTMRHLDARFRLDFMLLPGDAGYIRRLETRARGDSRIRFIAPVPMLDLPRHLNRYDLGLFLLPPTNFNYRHALPNKFFEFIQANLAVAIGPSPEMARLVRQHDCGVVSDDFSPQSLARRLNDLDQDRIDYYKQRSHEAAKDLCFERNAPVLLAAVENLLGRA